MDRREALVVGLRAARRDPLTWIVIAVAAIHAVGIGWGLPASDGWDNDGVAPRDFLAGLVETFSPGRYFTYPPVHLVLLGVLTSPVTVVALAKAPSLAPADVIGEVLKVPYMTAIAWIARLVSLAMSLGIVVAMARIAECVVPAERRARAGWMAAVACGVNASLTYYAHTTNLDVPYLFWASLGLLSLVRAVAWREPRRFRRLAVMTALAVGTKDQAYALLLLGVPATLAAWFALDAWARGHVRAIAKELGVALAIGAVLLVFVDAVPFNPTGFRARLGFLVGSASQDFAHYSNDWQGRVLVIKDSFLHFDRYYPVPLAAVALLGLVFAVRGPAPSPPGAEAWGGEAWGGERRAAALAPLFAMISFTLAFNCVARRTEHRFLLPQMTLAAVYIGIAAERLAFSPASRAVRIAWQAALSVLFAWGVFASLDVDANLVLDPRYDAERWLDDHVAPGDAVEVHGLNVYLPRFPAGARVVRVGPEPVAKRNPMPGIIEEKVDRFGAIEGRRPRWIVVSQGWVWRYLLDPHATEAHGRVLPPTQIASGSDPDGTWFFQGLVHGERGYRLAHASTWTSTLWPQLDIHASLSREIWIYERVP